MAVLWVVFTSITYYIMVNDDHIVNFLLKIIILYSLDTALGHIKAFLYIIDTLVIFVSCLPLCLPILFALSFSWKVLFLFSHHMYINDFLDSHENL